MNQILLKVKVKCAALRCEAKLKLEVPIKEELEIDSVPSRVELLELRRDAFEAAGWHISRHTYGWVCPSCAPLYVKGST